MVAKSAARNRYERQQEKILHDQLVEDIRRRGWLVVHCRTDKPATIRVGWPDMTVMNKGRAAMLELKAAGGVLSQKQRECIAEIESNGTPVLVTSDLAEAIRFLRSKLE